MSKKDIAAIMLDVKVAGKTALTIFLLVSLLSLVAATRNTFSLKHNGYDGLLVAIHDDVAEDSRLVVRLQVEYYHVVCCFF